MNEIKRTIQLRFQRFSDGLPTDEEVGSIPFLPVPAMGDAGSEAAAFTYAVALHTSSQHFFLYPIRRKVFTNLVLDVVSIPVLSS
jgi:hypothetical protein